MVITRDNILDFAGKRTFKDKVVALFFFNYSQRMFGNNEGSKGSYFSKSL